MRLVERVVGAALVLLPERLRDGARDAVGLAAGEELLAQRGHQRVHLLGDRLAQIVGLGGR